MNQLKMKVKEFRNLKEILVIIVFLTLAFLLVYQIGGRSTRITQSHHGEHHTVLVYELILGKKISNPYIVGSQINTYWFWHNLLADIVLKFKITPFEASLLFNAFALFLTLTVIYLILRKISNNCFLSLIFTLLPFSMLNPIGYLKFLILKTKNVLHNYMKPDTSLLYPVKKLFDINLDAHGGNVLGKFLNFNGMPIGIALFLIYTYLILVSWKKYSYIKFLLIFVTIFFILLVYPQAGIACFIVLFSRISAELIIDGLNKKKLLNRSTWELILATSVPLLLCFPYLRSVSSGYDSTISLNNLTQIRDNLVGIGWTLFPTIWILPIALFFLFNEKLNKLEASLSISSFVLAVISIILNVPGPRHEYKFAYFYVFIISSVILSFLTKYFYKLSTLVKTSLFIFSLLLIIITLLSNFLLYTESSWANENPYIYDGIFLKLNCSPNDFNCIYLQEISDWIKNNTSEKSLIFLDLKNINSFKPYILSHRKSVIVTTGSYKAYLKNVNYWEKLLVLNKSLIKKIRSDKPCGQVCIDLKNMEINWPEEMYAIILKKGNLELENYKIIYSNDYYKLVSVEF